jgi:hypothetical protein
MRSIALSASLAAIQELNIDVYYSVWDVRLSELISVLWGKGNVYDAYYSSQSANHEFNVPVDMLGSGEFMTLSINNMTNSALTDDFTTRLALRLDLPYTPVARRKMGDDSEDYYYVTHAQDADSLENFANLQSETFDSNGQDLNVLKTVTRYYYSEYIKKRNIFGKHSPRLHLQYFAQERVSRNSDIMDELRSKRSTYNSMIARGSDPLFMRRLMFFMYVMRAQERYDVPRKRNAARSVVKAGTDIYLVFYPVAGFFTPVALGGLGCTIPSIIGSSSDISCAMDAMINEELREYVNFFGNLVAGGGSNLSRKISKAALDKVTIDGVSRKIPGLEYIEKNVMDRFKMRRQSSYNALVSLKESGNLRLVPRDFQFIHFAEQVVGREIANARENLVEEFRADQRIKGRNLMRNKIGTKDLLKTHFGWLENLVINVKDDDEKVERKVHPFGCLHPNIVNMYNYWGVRLGDKGDLLVGIQLTQLLRKWDRHFPRHYDPDRLLDIINQNALMSNSILMTYALIAMGMNASIAPDAARHLIKKRADLLISGVNGGYSWGDPLFSNFPSAYNFENKQYLPMDRLNVMLNSIFRQHSMHYSSYFGRIIHCEYALKDNSVETIQQLEKSMGFLISVFANYTYKFDAAYYGIRN